MKTFLGNLLQSGLTRLSAKPAHIWHWLLPCVYVCVPRKAAFVFVNRNGSLCPAAAHHKPTRDLFWGPIGAVAAGILKRIHVHWRVFSSSSEWLTGVFPLLIRVAVHTPPPPLVKRGTEYAGAEDAGIAAGWQSSSDNGANSHCAGYEANSRGASPALPLWEDN